MKNFLNSIFNSLSLLGGKEKKQAFPEYTQTPLSDLITAILKSSTKANYIAFDRAFIEAELRVISRPKAIVGNANDEPDIQIFLTETPDGRLFIKACADPEVFIKRYDASFNTGISGRNLLKTALLMPHVEGILVCSAASVHSLILNRSRIKEISQNN